VNFRGGQEKFLWNSGVIRFSGEKQLRNKEASFVLDLHVKQWSPIPCKNYSFFWNVKRVQIALDFVFYFFT